MIACLSYLKSSNISHITRRQSVLRRRTSSVTTCEYLHLFFFLFNICLRSGNISASSRLIFPSQGLRLPLGSSNPCVAANACVDCTCSTPLWKCGHATEKRYRAEECSGARRCTRSTGSLITIWRGCDYSDSSVAESHFTAPAEI